MLVDKDIPLPDPVTEPVFKWPFGVMDVGDSILIEGKDEYRKGRNSADVYMHRHKRSKIFTSRWDKVTQTGRIWRFL